MQALQEQREYNERMLAAEHARRDKEWAERVVEAEKVERRHVENAKAAERRFWIGLVGAVLVTVLAQSILAYLKPIEKPVINVTVQPDAMPLPRLPTSVIEPDSARINRLPTSEPTDLPSP